MKDGESSRTFSKAQINTFLAEENYERVAEWPPERRRVLKKGYGFEAREVAVRQKELYKQMSEASD